MVVVGLWRRPGAETELLDTPPVWWRMVVNGRLRDGVRIAASTTASSWVLIVTTFSLGPVSGLLECLTTSRCGCGSTGRRGLSLVGWLFRQSKRKRNPDEDTNMDADD